MTHSRHARRAAVGAGQEEVSEKELRELMAAAGKDDIDGYSLSIPAGKQTGYKKVCARVYMRMREVCERVRMRVRERAHRWL